MQRVVEKTNKNRASKRGREQGVFNKLPQEDESAFQNVCRLWFIVKNDPRMKVLLQK